MFYGYGEHVLVRSIAYSSKKITRDRNLKSNIGIA